MPAPLNVPWSSIAVQAAAGATLEELSQHWGIPLNTLKARSAREGWKGAARRLQAEKSGTEPRPAGNSTLQPNATSRAVSLMHKLGERSKFRAAKVGDKTLKAMHKQPDDKLIRNAGAFKATVDGLSKIHGWGDQAPASTQPLVAIQLNGYVPPEA